MKDKAHKSSSSLVKKTLEGTKVVNKLRNKKILGSKSNKELASKDETDDLVDNATQNASDSNVIKLSAKKKSNLIIDKRTKFHVEASQQSKSITSSTSISSEVIYVTTDSSSPLENFELSPSTVASLRARGIDNLFPIQSATFNPIRNGQDLIGRARTGQGKTLAFCLPILENLIQKKLIGSGINPKVLIMSPTRELAKQIVSEFLTVTSNTRIEALYGGVSLQDNWNVLRRGIDVVVGTPGRIKDLLEKGWLRFDDIAHVVLDEADQMLDMGFQEEVQAIFAAIGDRQHQTCLFSATMPPWVHNLADQYMNKSRIVIDLVSDEKQKAGTTVSHIAIPTHWTQIGSTINDVIAMFAARQGRVLIFCPTKIDCDTVAMDKAIKHECQVLHGDIPQAKRESTLTAYKGGNFRVLVATDVAARGLDLSVELVIQTKPPIRMSGKADVETYVHRSGRTGRAGKTGVCVTLWTPKVKYALEEIERVVGNTFEWRGAPQPLDILQNTALQCADELKEVSQDILPYFKSAALSVIQQLGAEVALCAALAKLSGCTEKPKRKSLLASEEGMITLQFHSGKPILSNGYVFVTLNNHFPLEFTRCIKGMKLTKDGKSACFDISEEFLPLALKAIDETVGFQWLSICEELPALVSQEEERRGYTSNSGRGGGDNRGGRGGGGRGGRGVGGRFSSNNNFDSSSRSHGNSGRGNGGGRNNSNYVNNGSSNGGGRGGRSGFDWSGPKKKIAL